METHLLASAQLQSVAVVAVDSRDLTTAQTEARAAVVVATAQKLAVLEQWDKVITAALDLHLHPQPVVAAEALELRVLQQQQTEALVVLE